MLAASPVGQEAFICQQPALGELGLDIMGQLQSWYDQKITQIRAEVKQEVLAQVPRIRAEVAKEVMAKVPEIRSAVRTEAKAAVKPWVIAAIAVGAVGVAAGGIALYKLKKRRGKRRT